MSELILPPPRNKATEVIVSKMDTLIRPLIHNAIPEERLMAAIITELNNLPPNVDVSSAGIAARNVATIGLIPGPTFGHIHIIPFNNTKKGIVEAQVITGYRGYLELAFRNDFLSSVSSEVVLEGEKYQAWSDENGKHLRHDYDPFKRLATRGAVVGAYCSYRVQSGTSDVVFVSKDEINQIDTGKNVWKTNYYGMVLKTPVRRAAKMWRIAPDLARAVALDEQAERGETQTIDVDFEPIETHDPLQGLRGTLDLMIQKTDISDRDAYARELFGPQSTFDRVCADEALMKQMIHKLKARD